MSKIVTGWFFLLVLTACSNKTEQSPGAIHEGVLGEQVKALEKARGVEQTLQEAAARARAEENQAGY